MIKRLQLAKLDIHDRSCAVSARRLGYHLGRPTLMVLDVVAGFFNLRPL